MNQQLKELIFELEQSHIQNDIRVDLVELGEILAEDFFEIGSSGHVYTREECLTDGVVLSDMKMYNFELHPLAEHVVLTTYFIVDSTRKRNTYRSSIWKQVDGRWRLYFHQGTISPLQLSDVLKDI
jgi:hypothetical protein